MMTYRILALTFLAGMLAGCATMTPAERRAADEQTCAGYGFRRGTDGFANCLQRIDLSRRADRRAMEQDWFYNDPFMYGSPAVIYRPIYVPRR